MNRSIFLTLLGLLIIFVEPTTAVYTHNIKVYNEEIVVDAGSRLLIPCRFFMNRHFRSRSIALEWDMMPEAGGDYKLVLMIFNTTDQPVQQPNERAHAFIKQLQRGDCSLAINPTRVEDSGTYQVHLFFQGQQFSPFPKVKVHVRDCLHKSGAPDPYCADMDNTTTYIIAGGIAGGAILTYVLVLIGILVCRCKTRRQNDIEEGRVSESPIEASDLAQVIVHNGMQTDEVPQSELSFESEIHTPPRVLIEHPIQNLFVRPQADSFSSHCKRVYLLPGY